MQSSISFELFTQRLTDWFAHNQRDLPWRGQYDPYATWIAEVMMQQTQMERGVEYFERWMRRFPDIQSVAVADETTLLSAWEGLGYYRRVRNIQATAKVIMREHKGVFPCTYSGLIALPGIGPYTAGAIASTAFNEPVPCIDGNVERVLTRYFDIDGQVQSVAVKKQLKNIITGLMPKNDARNFNQALMELGALVCRKSPQCEFCPLVQGCMAHRLGIAHERPVKKTRTPVKNIEAATGVLEHDGRFFVQKRLMEGVWAGLWEFPGGCVEQGETPQAAIVREWQEELDFVTQVQRPITVIRHGYTTYKITLHCFRLQLVEQKVLCPTPPSLREASAWQWLDFAGLETIPMPAPHRKLVDFLQQHKEL